MTYYVFRPHSMSWRNHIVQAFLTSDPMTYQVAAWYAGTPWTDPLPLCTFTASRHAPKPDNFFTASLFDLYAPKLLDLLTQAGVPFETFPAHVYDRKIGDLLSDTYRVFHLLARYPALDGAASWRETRAIYRLWLRTDVAIPVPMFRIDEQDSIVVVHAELKQMLEDHGVTGCTYIPIEAYQSGAHTIRNQALN